MAEPSVRKGRYVIVRKPSKNGFCFYADWIEQLQDVTQRDFRRIITAIVLFRCYDEPLPDAGHFTNPVSRTAAVNIFRTCEICKNREFYGKKASSIAHGKTEFGNCKNSVKPSEILPESPEDPHGNADGSMADLSRISHEDSGNSKNVDSEDPIKTMVSKGSTPDFAAAHNVTEPNITEPNATAEAENAAANVSAGEDCSEKLIKNYHRLCPSLPQVEPVSSGTIASAANALSRHTPDEWEQVFRRAEASSFLRGGGQRGFRANLLWILEEKNFTQIASGKYDDAETEPQGEDGDFLELLKLNRTETVK